MLELQDLQIRSDLHGGPVLIDGFTLSVRRGEAVGLVGPSGCGKTTLLRCVVGLIDPAGGTVAVGGASPAVAGWPNFRRRVMLVAQRPVVRNGTVSENLLRPRGFKSIKHTYGHGDTEAMLAKVGLGDKHDAEATTLSEGERQRLCLVRALLVEPDFLILDEPTSALDEDSVYRVEALLQQRMTHRDGMGVLVATHDHAFAERFCSRMIDLAEYMPGGRAVTDA